MRATSFHPIACVAHNKNILCLTTSNQAFKQQAGTRTPSPITSLNSFHVEHAASHTHPLYSRNNSRQTELIGLTTKHSKLNPFGGSCPTTST